MTQAGLILAIVIPVILALVIVITLSVTLTQHNDPQTDDTSIQLMKGKTVIPPHCYMTWHTKTLPPKMKENFDYLVEKNPTITFHMYDDDDCREFLVKHFPIEIVNAFDRLIPGAYKADLWRYCILYQWGGIYMDIKFKTFKNVFLKDYLNAEYFVHDHDAGDNIGGIYNAFMITKPGNQKLDLCIQQIVKNVQIESYGWNSLSVTGPSLLGCYFTELEKNHLDFYLDVKKKLVIRDVHTGGAILEMYPEYRQEARDYPKNNLPFVNYSQLWYERNIYHII